MTPRAVLVGLPGSGKTTTGRRLARILAVPFSDSDELVESATGRTVAEIFAADGEPAFRAQEEAAIGAALHEFDGILALGGGALGSTRTRAALGASGVAVVVLHAPVATLAGRVGDALSRPLLAGDPQGRLRELAGQRNPTYDSLATLNIDTEGRTPGQVAATIAARLHQRGVRA